MPNFSINLLRLLNQVLYHRLWIFSDPFTTRTSSLILTKERLDCPRLEPGTVCAAVARSTDSAIVASESVFLCKI